MGYSHYFSAQREVTLHEWARLVQATVHLLSNLPEQVPLNYGPFELYPLRLAWEADCNLPPQVGPNLIRFNGSSISAHYQQPQLPPITYALVEAAQHTKWEETRTELHRLNHVPLLRDDYPGEGGYETFLLEAAPQREGWEAPEFRHDFSACKTDRKPYDAVVTAVLILCHHHAPGWRDIGGGYTSEWQVGLDLVRTTFPNKLFTLPPGVRDAA